MIPNRHAMVGARPSAGFGLIAELVGNAGDAIAWPSFVQPGDLAILGKKGSAAPSPWTQKAASSANRTPGVYSLILGPTDIITPLVPNANYTCLVYRGIQSIELRASEGTQGPPGTQTNRLGFTKDPQCAGRVAFSGVSLGYFIPTVSTFTVRATQAEAVSHWNVLDNPSLDGPTIAAGVTITWNTVDANGPGWLMFELLK